MGWMTQTASARLGPGGQQAPRFPPERQPPATERRRGHLWLGQAARRRATRQRRSPSRAVRRRGVARGSFPQGSSAERRTEREGGLERHHNHEADCKHDSYSGTDGSVVGESWLRLGDHDHSPRGWVGCAGSGRGSRASGPRTSRDHPCGFQIVMTTFPRTTPASRCRIASGTRSSG